MKQENKLELLKIIDNSIARHQAEINNRQKWEAYHKKYKEVNPDYDFDWSNKVKERHIKKIKMLNEIRQEIETL